MPPSVEAQLKCPLLCEVFSELTQKNDQLPSYVFQGCAPVCLLQTSVIDYICFQCAPVIWAVTLLWSVTLQGIVKRDCERSFESSMLAKCLKNPVRCRGRLELRFL